MHGDGRAHTCAHAGMWAHAYDTAGTQTDTDLLSPPDLVKQDSGALCAFCPGEHPVKKKCARGGCAGREGEARRRPASPDNSIVNLRSHPAAKQVWFSGGRRGRARGHARPIFAEDVLGCAVNVRASESRVEGRELKGLTAKARCC